MKRTRIVLGLVLTLAAVALAIGLKLAPALTVHAPPPMAKGKRIRLAQGWSEAQSMEFHHTAQGTRLLRYEWLVALEQPCLSFAECSPLIDAAYLSRFGFIESPKDPRFNPDGLPVGFARQADFFDPENGSTYAVAGLACAACHTGLLQYGGYDVLVEGAPAMIDAGEFQKAMGLALLLTKWNPSRYSRFESKVLGPNAKEAQKAELKHEFESFLESMQRLKKVTDDKGTYANVAGFARTDALTRIGNQVFAVDMNIDDNFATSNAPVRYPQIWDAPWFDWVQYNSSISDPLVRNIGQALGVRAVAKLSGEDAAEFKNSIRMEGLKAVEDLLAGPAPFQGLQSPKWPAVFPPLDSGKVAAGADLYRKHCQPCHLPPPPELQKDLAAEKPVHWRANKNGRRLLRVTDVPLEYVGTDPRQALDFLNRTADTGALKKGRVSAADGLTLVTGTIRDRFFQKMNFTPEQRLEWSGYRDPSEQMVRALKIYKARPLNGIWAVAPYLHNGSVPNLYAMLSPQTERPATFWLGTKKFDPVRVGYESGPIEGGYLYDTSITGNSNQGHQFTDGPRGKGTIGPALTPEERWALIEYLKSL
jgi:mono/diheme cytochrome c family protein